jgi:hypothetical protein
MKTRSGSPSPSDYSSRCALLDVLWRPACTGNCQLQSPTIQKPRMRQPLTKPKFVLRCRCVTVVSGAHRSRGEVPSAKRELRLRMKRKLRCWNQSVSLIQERNHSTLKGCDPYRVKKILASRPVHVPCSELCGFVETLVGLILPTFTSALPCGVPSRSNITRSQRASRPIHVVSTPLRVTT